MFFLCVFIPRLKFLFDCLFVILCRFIVSPSGVSSFSSLSASFLAYISILFSVLFGNIILPSTLFLSSRRLWVNS